MPFCPQCKVEYRKGFTQCNDCMVGLVDQLPEEPKAAPAEPAAVTRAAEEEFVELAVDMHPDEFLFTLNVLEDHGVPVVSSDGYQSLVHNFIKVPVGRLEEAAGLLEKFKFERGAEPVIDENVIPPVPPQAAVEETGSGVNPMIIIGIMAGVTLLIVLLKYLQNN